MTDFEEKVKAAHEEIGWQCLRDGWPDFLMYRIVDGKIELMAAEVKSETYDNLQPNQKKMLALLSTVMQTVHVHEGPGFGDYMDRKDMHALVYRLEHYLENDRGKL